jgi:hypothetical protein
LIEVGKAAFFVFSPDSVGNEFWWDVIEIYPSSISAMNERGYQWSAVIGKSYGPGMNRIISTFFDQ